MSDERKARSLWVKLGIACLVFEAVLLVTVIVLVATADHNGRSIMGASYAVNPVGWVVQSFIFGLFFLHLFLWPLFVFVVFLVLGYIFVVKPGLSSMRDTTKIK